MVIRNSTVDFTYVVNVSVCSYKVRTVTGNSWFAGTHADVVIQLFGSQGKTDWKGLTHPGKRFSRGK